MCFNPLPVTVEISDDQEGLELGMCFNPLPITLEISDDPEGCGQGGGWSHDLHGQEPRRPEETAGETEER